MPQRRINISLDEDVAQLLERVENKSGYLANAVRERWEEWQNALSVLLSLGWRRAEVLAACDSTNGLLHHGPMPGSYMAAELADSAALNGLCAKWEIDPVRWSGLVHDVAHNLELAHALWTISREFFAHNLELEQKLERLGPPSPA